MTCLHLLTTSVDDFDFKDEKTDTDTEPGNRYAAGSSRSEPHTSCTVGCACLVMRRPYGAHFGTPFSWAS